VSVQPAARAEARLLDEPALRRLLVRLAHEVTERHPRSDELVLIGIRTRGAPLAARLADLIAGFGRPRPKVLAVDPADFRDDRPRRAGERRPALSGENGEAGQDIGGAGVVLVDDVLYTGRTQRAAIEAVLAAGRPASVEVLVLVDRGHREMPVRATYVGKNVPTSAADRVAVRLRDVDGVEGAWLLHGQPV
jgi:pyrimidine operon attenuation protein/uracil phosphoribosyltransferase